MEWMGLGAVLTVLAALATHGIVSRRREAAARRAARRAAAVLESLQTVNRLGVGRVQDASAEAIERFSSLVERIRRTTEASAEVLSGIREAVPLGLTRTGTSAPAGPSAIRAQYADLFRSVEEQLALITDRRAEEVARLEELQAAGPGEDRDAGLAAAIEDLKTAAVAEDRLIRSTLQVLEAVVRSLVESAIRIDAVVEGSLGASSSMGDEIAAITVHLQCEDICQEMGGQTLAGLAEALAILRRVRDDW